MRLQQYLHSKPALKTDGLRPGRGCSAATLTPARGAPAPWPLAGQRQATGARSGPPRALTRLTGPPWRAERLSLVLIATSRFDARQAASTPPDELATFLDDAERSIVAGEVATMELDTEWHGGGPTSGPNCNMQCGAGPAASTPPAGDLAAPQ